MRFTALAIALSSVAHAQEFEVVVFGTHHAPGMFYSDDYTPAHIAAALEKAEPDVVAVESHPDWFAVGRYHVVTFEGEGVAVPWARARELPVHGVDWKDIQRWDRSEQLGALTAAEWVASMASGGEVTRWGLGLPNALPTGAVDFRHINSAEYGATRTAGITKDDPNFAAQRDREIAANCVRVMEAHAGERLAVVIGAHHKPFLDELLSRLPGVKVLQPGVDFEWPSATEIADAWTADTLQATLTWRVDGRGTYGAPFTDEWRANFEALLERIESDGERPMIAKYLRARLHQESGDDRGAAALLDEVLAGAQPGTDLYPFPMRWWRMRYDLLESASLERARIAQRTGGEDSLAQALLRDVEAAAKRRLRDIERTSPRELRAYPAVTDAGFELGAEASDIFEGWADYIPTGQGRVEWSGGESAHGDRSLLLTIAENAGRSFHVRQECRVPAKYAHETFSFQVSARSHGLSDLRVQIIPFWGSRDRQPLAQVDLDPQSSEWQTARLEFDVPSNGQFGIFIGYAGPEGATLSLDAASPLHVDFMTRPREWSRAVQAAAYPLSLLTGSKDVVATPAITGASSKPASAGELVDAGFRRGASAASPLSGWYFDDDSNAISASADRSVRTEGDESLQLVITSPLNDYGGRHSVNQTVQGLAGSQTFALDLRSDVAGSVQVVACVWSDDNVYEELASKAVPLSADDWATATLDFTVPGGARSVGLFVYVPEGDGCTLWLDGATLSAN